MEREEPEAWSGNGGSEEQGNEESQALNVSDVGKHTHTTHTPTVYYSVHEELLSRALELLSSALLQKWLGMKPAGCKVWGVCRNSCKASGVSDESWSELRKENAAVHRMDRSQHVLRCLDH